uniref:Uncharacterized protein n=1 Tax=Trichuris muris TaxID=70415 RepID=A0A5S6Q4E1_TRIMR
MSFSELSSTIYCHEARFGKEYPLSVHVFQEGIGSCCMRAPYETDRDEDWPTRQTEILQSPVHEEVFLTHGKTAMFIYSCNYDYTAIEFCSKEIYVIIVTFANECDSVKHVLGMSTKCDADWKKCIREVDSESLLKNPLVIGGPVLTVDVDETVFSRRNSSASKFTHSNGSSGAFAWRAV